MGPGLRRDDGGACGGSRAYVARLLASGRSAKPALPLRVLQSGLLGLGKAVVEGVAGAADGADRVLLAADVEQLAQAADMHVDGTFVDVDVAAPDAVEQLLTGEHAARMLQEEFEQAIFGRSEIDRTARARHAALLAV